MQSSCLSSEFVLPSKQNDLKGKKEHSGHVVVNHGIVCVCVVVLVVVVTVIVLLQRLCSQTSTMMRWQRREPSSLPRCYSSTASTQTECVCPEIVQAGTWLQPWPKR